MSRRIEQEPFNRETLRYFTVPLGRKGAPCGKTPLIILHGSNYFDFL